MKIHFLPGRSINLTCQHQVVVAILYGLAMLVGGCSHTARLPDPLQAGWQGEPVCELIHEDDKMRVLRCTFAPGVGHERHFHSAHYGYVIAGSTMRVTDDKGVREIDVPTGSDFSSGGIEWHEVLNVGDSTSVFLIIEPK